MIRSQEEGDLKYLIWVKGHSSVVGNEMVDYKAKEGAITGKLLGKPNLATPAGTSMKHWLHRIEDDNYAYGVTQRGPSPKVHGIQRRGGRR